MDLERRPKLVLEARPGGRERGRPRLEWEEYVEGLARKRGRKLPDVKYTKSWINLKHLPKTTVAARTKETTVIRVRYDEYI
jgi:hypothetical protein